MYRIIVKPVLARWCNLDMKYEAQRFMSRNEADEERRSLIADCEDIDPTTQGYASAMIRVVKVV